MSQTEAIRDFNGWSWDISTKDIENNVINIMFQVLVYLLGYEFINSWANNTSQLADYLMLTYENLKENFGEERAKAIVKILCKISIEEKGKKSKGFCHSAVTSSFRRLRGGSANRSAALPLLYQFSTGSARNKQRSPVRETALFMPF